MEANSRLTATTAAILLALLAAEGVTIPFIGPMLGAHVVIGMIIVPPVLVKVVSTGYRLIRYYRHDPAYVRKGPPPPLLRLLGPFVVILTVVLIATGIGSLFVTGGTRQNLLLLHKASFVLWFGAMTIHVLGHFLDTARLAPRDWMRRSRRDVAGASTRQWIAVVGLAFGVLLATLVVGRVGWFWKTSQFRSPGSASSSVGTRTTRDVGDLRGGITLEFAEPLGMRTARDAS
ncbi:MAG: hypothetical protein WB770_05265 [Acidimicrobiales bacterium]